MSRPASAPVLPPLPADTVARDLAAAEKSGARESVSVSAPSSSSDYDSAFGDDDLDIPDFLK